MFDIILDNVDGCPAIFGANFPVTPFAEK